MTTASFTADSRRLMKLLDTLPTKVSRKVSRNAVNAGATPILQAARSEAPVVTGNLKQSLGKKTKVYGETAVALVGPRISGRFKGYHGHLIHNGHIAADGSFVPGNPFLRRAHDNAAAPAQSAMISKLSAGIESEAKKL